MDTDKRYCDQNPTENGILSAETKCKTDPSTLKRRRREKTGQTNKNRTFGESKICR